jgi:hypothetical protein
LFTNAVLVIANHLTSFLMKDVSHGFLTEIVSHVLFIDSVFQVPSVQDESHVEFKLQEAPVSTSEDQV